MHLFLCESTFTDPFEEKEEKKIKKTFSNRHRSLFSSLGIELLLRDQVYDDCYPLHAVSDCCRHLPLFLPDYLNYFSVCF